jgi:hypothetical protein
MKKRIGVIERDIRISLTKYKNDEDLLALLKATLSQSRSHVHYYWQYRFFVSKLESIYEELMRNANPSHREGKVERNAVSS